MSCAASRGRWRVRWRNRFPPATDDPEYVRDPATAIDPLRVWDLTPLSRPQGRDCQASISVISNVSLRKKARKSSPNGPTASKSTTRDSCLPDSVKATPDSFAAGGDCAPAASEGVSTIRNATNPCYAPKSCHCPIPSAVADPATAPDSITHETGKRYLGTGARRARCGGGRGARRSPGARCRGLSGAAGRRWPGGPSRTCRRSALGRPAACWRVGGLGARRKPSRTLGAWARAGKQSPSQVLVIGGARPGGFRPRHEPAEWADHRERPWRADGSCRQSAFAVTDTLASSDAGWCSSVAVARRSAVGERPGSARRRPRGRVSSTAAPPGGSPCDVLRPLEPGRGAGGVKRRL